jgi:RsiW-degrading membrane proteinase PrsW (M82 family)
MENFFILIGLLPSFAWLIFYLREDLHPEPRRLIFLTFLGGATVTLLAYAAQVAINTTTRYLGLAPQNFTTLFSLAAVEETFKFAAAYFIVARNKAFDEPVDAMVYLIVAALGFAAVENLGIVDSTIDSFRPMIGTSLLAEVLQTTTLRFIGATLLHTLSSGIVGYYWAKGILRQKAGLFACFGLLIASFLHAFFNYSILNYGAVIASIFFLIIVSLFVLNDFEKLKAKVFLKN